MAKTGEYQFVPLTKGQLHAYAKDLQRANKRLSWKDALELATQHEADRVQNYAQIDENLSRKRGQKRD